MDPTPIDSASMIGHPRSSAAGSLRRGRDKWLPGSRGVECTNSISVLHWKSGPVSNHSSPLLPRFPLRLTGDYTTSYRVLSEGFCVSPLVLDNRDRQKDVHNLAQYDVHDDSLCRCTD
ncbi:uncharacterized protein N7473_001514 [Penicillium subrubescens]|uniref:uncharacterized protein n=1 Tax=Penicillium subrubescens TaxID=1316194 RepID=UPI0025453E85|nr:uncharacterized protein N7473_001514 [Penicillium subrubescens]KAJ5912211.1 hypothetical protein N7473_001514 [Penicillium subrubescens]